MIETRPIDSITPYDRNPRKNDGRPVDAVLESLKRHGQVKPIVLSAKGHPFEQEVICCGHTTLKALKKFGAKEVKVVVKEFKDEAEFLDLNLRDNKSGEFSEWDEPELLKLAAEFEVDLPEMGFVPEDFEQEAKEITEDEVPEPPADPITNPGDLWILGEHRLLCGDSTKAEDVARLMGGGIAEMLFTSPPYSDMREYSGNNIAPSVVSNFLTAFSAHCNYIVFNLGIQRKDHDIIQYWDEYIIKAKATGRKFLSWNVWWKNTISIGQQSAFMPIEHEWIFVFGHGFKHINREEERKTKIIDSAGTKRRQADGSTKTSSIGVQEGKKELGSVFNSNPELGAIRGKHPATFPVIFPERYILAITNTGDIVADPFLGSGTTLIAAEQLGRKCYGMEISPAYCDVIVKRWETLTGKKAVRE